MKRWQIFLVALAAAAALLAWKREPAMMAYVAGKTPKTSLNERAALLADAIEVRLPDIGEGPFPVVLQFHGCAGIRAPFQEQWADVANRAGYAAMIVDSNSPRGYSREASLDVVCDGKALLGQERAGDVLAALHLAKANPGLDTEQIVLAGWSHGGWSVMDYLTMDFKGLWPAGLKPADHAPPQVAGAILFYPYCGTGALSRFRKWSQKPDVLALIAGADTIVNADECIAYFQNREQAGEPVNIAVYPGAEHVFDDPFLEPDYISWYNEKYHKDAMGRYDAFLRRLKAPAAQ